MYLSCAEIAGATGLLSQGVQLGRVMAGVEGEQQHAELQPAPHRLLHRGQVGGGEVGGPGYQHQVLPGLGQQSKVDSQAL